MESQHYCNSRVHDLHHWVSPVIRNQKLPTVAVDKECGRWVQIAMVSGGVSFCQLDALPHPRTCSVRNLTEPG